MSERKIRKLKERVAKSLARQNYEDALEAALELLELDPRDDRTLLKVGELHQRLGQEAEALKAYHRVADFYADDGRLVRAISVLKMILGLAPEDTATAKKLSLLYAARGLPPTKAVKAMLDDKSHAVDHAAPPAATPAPAPAASAPAEGRPPGAAATPPRAAVEASPEAASAPPPAPAVAAPAPPAASPPPPPHQAVAFQEISVEIELPVDFDSAPTPEAPKAPKATGAEILEAMADAEDPFAESAEEVARRQLAQSDLQSLDLDDLDLAFVELAPDAAPEMPHTPLFSDLAPEELHALLGKVQARSFEAGAELVTEGEEGASIFVVSDGVVIVVVGEGEASREVARLKEGAFFGEFGMLTDGRRHATVIAQGQVEALEIHHDDLLELTRAHPRVRQVLVTFYRKRAMETALAASRVFGSLDEEARDALARCCSEERHQAESTVLQEGDDGEGIFLVKRGKLRVESRGLTDQAVPLAELGPGDFFGEISTLSGSPVTADVVAMEAVEILKISRREVLEFCGEHPGVREALEAIGKRRLHESIDRLTSAGLV